MILELFANIAHAAEQGAVAVPQLDVITKLSNLITYEIGHYQNILPLLRSINTVWMWFALPISAFCIIGTFIAVDGILRIRKAERKVYHPWNVVEAEVTPAIAKPDHEMANRWRHVMESVESENENDWRQAILEADIMLDDLLVKLGYQGEGVGGRLKRAQEDPGDFKSIQKAWDGHTVRNRIAHEGKDYPLTHHEAKRVIHSFREVFEEFFFI
ncbi:MAG: protein of unknown function with transrane region [Candidatus Taylorbacteria bacterium]|nr:protein of unknown function with transrane region [Candidatus Taylorbacteria bacterium]